MLSSSSGSRNNTRESRICTSKWSWSRCGPAHYWFGLSALPIESGPTRCWTCVISPSQSWPVPSVRFPGNSLLFEVHCFYTLMSYHPPQAHYHPPHSVLAPPHPEVEFVRNNIINRRQLGGQGQNTISTGCSCIEPCFHDLLTLRGDLVEESYSHVSIPQHQEPLIVQKTHSAVLSSVREKRNIVLISYFTPRHRYSNLYPSCTNFITSSYCLTRRLEHYGGASSIWEEKAVWAFQVTHYIHKNFWV